MFVDLAENIHIHYREYRTVFSLDEYFEYADILAKSTVDVRNFLEQNPQYKENKYPTTIMIAGGKERQLKFLENSPKPNQSKYFKNDFAIELQDVFVTDEIHVHYRDFRIAMDRERFKKLAKGFAHALRELNKFEESEDYEREHHPDRIIDFNKSSKGSLKTKQMGIKSIALTNISSNWFADIMKDWKPSSEIISSIMKSYNEDKYFAPIILSTEKNGKNLIVDGHHRYYASVKLNLDYIDAIVVDLTFEETKKIREAEVLLKQFDQETNHKYTLASFMKSYIGYRLNRYYASSFRRKMRSQALWYRALRKIKRVVFGKRQIFKSFNESHNHHN